MNHSKTVKGTEKWPQTGVSMRIRAGGSDTSASGLMLQDQGPEIRWRRKGGHTLFRPPGASPGPVLMIATGWVSRPWAATGTGIREPPPDDPGGER